MAALGASAGGLTALEAFFAHTPVDSGVAFIVVQHLSPDHASALVDLLSRCTLMPVQEAAQNTKILSNCVYVIPPNTTLTVKDCTLHIESPTQARGRRTPIDALFSSLAEDQGDRAVCIILSGTGTDGTQGLRAVKEHSGMAMAQSLDTAKYDAMLRSAISTGLVDHVLPVEEMPAKLVDYAAHLDLLKDHPTELRLQIAKYSSRIHGILRRTVGHDFSEYKEGTIMRRLERRMNALQIDDVEEYAQLLGREPAEAHILFKDLLIGVTEFFRDPEAFEALERIVIPKLFQQAAIGKQLRVCVVGCATGEEAYTLAIVLTEYAAKLENPPDIKVFATDIDDRGLEVARKGVYPDGIAESVSPERLERFFTKQEGGYRVKRQIRDLCLFSHHSFIKDPPFSRLDLISCRNVLIYLGDSLQRKVVPLLHYALRPDGYLFLGLSESVGSYRELFQSIDKKYRIFQKKNSLPRTPVAFPLGDLTRAKTYESRQIQRDEEHLLSKRLERIILQRYAPACVIVNEHGDGIYFSGGIGRYLEQPTGSPDTNVVNMAGEGLRIPLRAALHKAATTHERVFQQQILVDAGGRSTRVDLLVEPISEFQDANLFMVVITDSPVEGVAKGSNAYVAELSSAEIIRGLENELRAATEHAQAMFEELESSNEELSSANEEFQSTNEELETSKEELQSFNEELETVNFELNRKVAELDAANSDLQNLLNGTQIATIFLDTELNVRNFTPAAANMFRLIGSDIGRPITDLAAQFIDADLVRDAKEVLATLSIQERQVRGSDEQHYQQRILPYRTVSNLISGVVLTFVDVTELRRAEALAQTARAYAESIVDTVREPLVVLDHAMQIASASKAFYEIFGVSAEETIGRSLFELGGGQWDIPQLRTLLSQVLPKNSSVDNYRVTHHFPKVGSRTMLLNARRMQPGKDRDPLVLLAIEDITEREEFQAALLASDRLHREIIEAVPATVYTTDANGRVTMYNQAAIEFSGRVPQIGTDFWCVTWKLYNLEGALLPFDQSPMAIALKEDRPLRGVEAIAERPDGTRRNFVAYPTPLHDSSGKVTGAVNMLVDITELRKIEKERTEFLARERAFAAEHALHEAQSELARISRALTVGELATSIAHEVNQPLAGIVTNAEACLRWLNAPTPNIEEAQQSLNLIVRDGNRASDIIRRIRDFLKKDSSSAASLDINEVIEEALVLATGELLKSQVEVKLDLSSGMPPIVGHRLQLQQVILNLIINGREAMAGTEGPRQLTVSSAKSGDDGVEVAVRDSGPHVPAETIERMFDALFTTKPSGMGMGLSISRSIVEAHGGRIWATPNQDSGLTVQFRITNTNE